MITSIYYQSPKKIEKFLFKVVFGLNAEGGGLESGLGAESESESESESWKGSKKYKISV